MSRFLLLVISVMAVVMPGSVLALGLGQIELQSGLNQPFRAEIPLTSASADEVTRLKVRLASAETFERYGLLQAGFLTRFDFSVTSSGGRSAIRITSVEPVVEPFVTMLLEVEWAQGRLLREYTVLLDPPVYDAPVAAPARPAPAPVPRPGSRPVQRPAPAAQPGPGARPSTSSAPLGSFGPVQRNDTLWNIANRTRPDASITMNQMMVAIFAANPEAFDGNINRLRAGAILRIPDAGEVTQTSRRDAFAEVRRQNESWRGAAPPPADSARLRLVPPAGEDAAAQEPGARDSGAAASGRVAELQAQLAERERLLEVKNQELADLQAQLAELRDKQLDELVADDMAPADTGAEALVEDEIPAADEMPLDEAPVDEVVADEMAGEAETEAPGPARVIPPAVTTRQEEPSFISQLIGNPWLYGGLVLALLVGLFIAKRRRSDELTGTWEQLGGAEAVEPDLREATDRLRAPIHEAEETFVVEETPAQETGALEAGRSGTVEIDLNREGDQELPLEKTLSSDSALNLDQSDPLAEAEFHSAYGLYDQAADLLNAALQAEPDRLDLRRKLIEVYFSWDNRGGFQKAAQEYHDRVDSGDQFWNKVLVMGKQLCPDEALFAAAPTSPASGEDMDMDLALGDDSGGEVDLALGDEDADVDLDLSGIRPMPEDAGLDFDLGDALMADDDDLSPTERQDPGAEAPTMETPTIESPGPSASTMETPTIEVPGPSTPTVETPTIEQPMSETTMETPTIETQAGDFSEDTGRTSETAALDLDELGLDLSEFEDALGDEEDQASRDDDATLLASELEDPTLLAGDVVGLESTSEVEQLTGELPSDDSVDAFLAGDITAEQAGPDVDALTQAMEKSSAADEIGDTAEQPQPEVEETAEQPGPGAPEGLAGGDAGDLVDFDVGERATEEEAPTGTMDKPPRGREGPTMTEVGTKLDLARAYIDMGDPEGARSILGEVIEEGDEPQRQEAQRLLDTLSA